MSTVSIIIRTYNSGATAIRAIESVLAQEESIPQEIVVVDDGSMDDTLAQLEPYRKRIRLVPGEHRGPVAALNKGIEESQGTYYTILDSDDVLLPGGLSALYHVLTAAPEKGFSYGDYIEQDAAGITKVRVSTKQNILNTTAGGILFRKDIVENIGKYKENLFFPEYDVLLTLRKKYPGIHVDVFTYVYLRRKGSVTSDPQQVAEGKKQLEERYGPLPGLRSY